MSDLNTEIKIGADASGVEAGVTKAKRSLKDLGDSAKKAGKDAGDGFADVGKGGDSAAKKVESATRSMQGSLQRLIAEQKAGGKASREYYEALADTRGISRAAIKPLLDQLDAAKAKTLAASNAASSWQSNLSRIGPAVAAAFSAAAIGNFVGKVVSVQREFDVLNSSLKTVTGSGAAAERELAWLKTFAKETPFGLAQATQGFVKMKALGLDPTRAALTSFGNTASAMGKDLNQIIEAVADASTGEFERLKEFGIKAKKEGDNVALTFQGVTKTIGNNAAEINKYLESIGNTQFAGAMEERAKTLDGTISALGDTWDELFRTVSTNNVGGLIFDSVTLANGAIEDATTILKSMGGAAGDAGKGTGALAAIQGGLATVFETVAVVGANVKYVLAQVGNEVGGLAAQVAQAAQFNFSGVAAIRAQMVADAQAARKEIDATTERILNARKEQERYLSYATRNASAAVDPRRVDLGGATIAPASAATAKAVKEAVSEYDKLIKKLGEEIPKAAAEAEAAQMGYNKAQTEFLALARSPEWAKFSNTQRANVAALFETKIASEQASEATKTLAKANLDAANAREKYLTSLDAGLDKIKADTAAQIDATARLGLSKEAIAALDAAKLEMLATDLELQAIKAMDRNLDEATYNSLKKQAEAYRDLAKAKQGNAAKEATLDLEKASIDAAKKADDEWLKTADSINQSLTDALLRAFESGKDFAQALKTTVINMFKTLVLRPVISAIVNPVAGALTGALGLAGTASAATSGASALGSAGSLLSGVGALAGNFGAGLSTGFSGLMAGNLGSTLGLGTGLIGSGATAGGLGTIAGALGPIALGIGALVTLAKKFDTSGTPHIGAGAVYSEYGGLQEGASIYNKATFGQGVAEEYAKATQEGVSTIAKTLTQTFDGIAKTFGKTAGYEIATAFADDSSKDGAWGSLRISQGGRDALNWAANPMREGVPREFANGEEGYKGYLAAIAKDTRQVLLDMDLPSWADTILESIGEAGSIEQLSAAVQQIGQIQTTFVQLGKTIEGFAGLSDGAFSALMKASGGFEALATSASAYYDNFYSEGEKAATVTRSVADALKQVGIAMPATREEFRALVETNLALGESGATAVAALLGVSGAFASVVPAAADAAKAIGNVLSETMRRLQSDSSSLQIELLQAQGRESDALALRREIETQGFNAAEVAAYDYNQSLRASITATNAASAALKAYKTAASSISTSKDTLAGIVRSPVEIAQNALNQTLLRLNETLKPANVVKDDYTYFTLYQDVLDFWKSESGKGGALAGVSAEEYAQIHYESSGKSEGRMSPQEALDLITTLVPNYNPLTLDDVLKLDTSGQGGYSAEQWEVIADVFAKAANVKLAAETPVTPATSVVDTSNAALSDILQERMTLQERYDALTMTSTQLLEKQRNALDESNRALFDSIQLEEKKATVAAERKGLQDQYDELTLTSAQLLERQRDALDESNRALFDSIQTIKSEAKAREDAAKASEAAKNVTDLAFSAVQRAVDAQRSVAQETISSMQAVFEMTRDGAKALYSEVDSTRSMSAAAGRAFIDNALSNARATGYMPDADGLREAIDGVRSGVQAQQYATSFEAERDRLVLAGKLTDLKDLAEPQLTEAQRQLKVLDATLENARKQIDVLRGIDVSVLSVADAVQALAAAIAAESALKKAAAMPTTIAGAVAGGYITSPVSGGSYTGVGDSGYRLEGNTLYFPGEGSHSVSGPGAIDALLDAYGLKEGGLNGTLIRTRAMGGYTPQGMTLVGEQGPELVDFKTPGMVYTAAQTQQMMGGGGAEVVAELRALRSEVAAVRAAGEHTASNTAPLPQLAEQFDNVTEGGTAMRRGEVV